MSLTVDQIYEKIADNIVSSIDHKWETAFIDFLYFGDAAEYKGTYISEKGSEETEFKVGYKNYKLLKELNLLTSTTQKPWNHARYVLSHNGEFSVTFEWDQDLADEIEADS